MNFNKFGTENKVKFLIKYKFFKLFGKFLIKELPKF